MTKISLNFFRSCFTLAAIALITSCGDEKGTANLQIALIDSPADFEAVNIDVQDVQINSGTDEGGFNSLEGVNTGVFDLLELTNGLEMILADVEIPAGRLSQIRLILGENNSLLMDGESQALTVPSGSQSGLKLNVNLDLEEGITYKVLLDFDAAKSVVSAGSSGKYNLKPVIRTILEATSGAIKGTVDPVQTAVISATLSGNTEATATTFTDETGAFLLRGLEAGTYEVSIESSDELNTQTIQDVSVEIGSVTDVGVIVL